MPVWCSKKSYKKVKKKIKKKKEEAMLFPINFRA